MKLHVYVLSGLMVISAVTCKKDSDTGPEPVKPPEISSFSPTEGAAGALISITGKNFIDVKGVTFNGVKAYFTLNGSNIDAVVPAASADGKITVQTATGSHTSTASFKVLVLQPGPTIKHLYPNNNPAQWPVMIDGENIDSITSIRFNNINAPIDTNFSGVVTTRVPAGISAGEVDVTVTSKNGTSNKLTFTVLAKAPDELTPPLKYMFKKKARYSPVVSNYWGNEFGKYGFQINTTNGFYYYDDIGNYYDMDIIPNLADKTIEAHVYRYSNFNYYDVYKGTYVESDDPNQLNPKRQRIIFVSPAGRQIVVGVDVQ